MPVPVTRNGTSSTGSAGGARATDWAAAGAASASVAMKVAGTSLKTMPTASPRLRDPESGPGCARAHPRCTGPTPRCRRARASASTTGGCETRRSVAAGMYEPGLQRVLGQPHALGLLWQLVEPEALIQHAHMALDGVDAEV